MIHFLISLLKRKKKVFPNAIVHETIKRNVRCTGCGKMHSVGLERLSALIKCNCGETTYLYFLTKPETISHA